MELPVETAFEHCPLCGSDLSQIKFREIQLKLQDDEKKKSAKLADAELAIHRRIETQLKKEFEERNRAAEQRVKDEAEKQVKKMAAERDQAAKQMKEAQLHEVEVRKQTQLEIEGQKKAAEKQIRQEVAQQLKNVAAERDQAAKKLKEAQEREIESRKQVQIEIENQRQAAEKKAKEEAAQQIKKVASERDQFAQKLKATEARGEEVRTKALKEADEKWQKDVMLQRQALENDKAVALLKQQANFSRQSESLQKKLRLVENQLKKKTANELGDGAEIDLFEALRDAYQGDNIKRIPKGQAGADILHVVMYKGVGRVEALSPGFGKTIRAGRMDSLTSFAKTNLMQVPSTRSFHRVCSQPESGKRALLRADRRFCLRAGGLHHSTPSPSNGRDAY